MWTLHQEIHQNDGKVIKVRYKRQYKTLTGAMAFRERLVAKHGYDINDIAIKGSEERKPRVASADAGAVNVGDVFFGIYGYNIEVVDYYEVVSVSPTGKTCAVRRLSKTYDRPMNSISGCHVLPRMHMYAGPVISGRRITMRTGKPTIAVSSDKRAELASPAELARPMYEQHND
jgi:hypothetical protein